MGILYFAGQRPGAGVTALATGLATLWRRSGKRVAVVKPIALAANADAAFYARAFDAPSNATALLPADARDAALQAAAERVAELDTTHDVVIVEGLPYADAQGAPVPESPALAEQMDAKVIGVIPYRHALGAADAHTWRNAYASSLAGVVFTRLPDGREHDVTQRLVPAFEDAGISVHGVLPEQRLLLAPTVGQIVDLLNGTYYAGPGHEDDLVEHFLIGGLITEWGGNYFNRYPNQAVVVRGGRMDIQMAALEFPMACLLLTGCDRPPQYVQQRARDLDVPLVTVTGDTLSTTSTLEQLEPRVNVDHPAKVALLAGMARDAIDLDAIAGAVGVPTA